MGNDNDNYLLLACDGVAELNHNDHERVRDHRVGTWTLPSLPDASPHVEVKLHWKRNTAYDKEKATLWDNEIDMTEVARVADGTGALRLGEHVYTRQVPPMEDKAHQQ